MPFPNGIRPDSHAGSWYEEDANVLSQELSEYFQKVPSTLHSHSLPIPSARAVIAPHAGYSYSGPCAAWSYAALDLGGITRIFVLGPSHTYYLENIALSTATKYATPFGNLAVDTKSSETFRLAVEKAGVLVADMPVGNEEDEHSLEMHMPYLYKRCEQTFGADDAALFPGIVPVLVGDLSTQGERTVGKVLAEELKKDGTALVISSDFCHWGSHFRYRVHAPDRTVKSLGPLTSSWVPKAGEPKIHETIEMIDRLAMDAVEAGKLDGFKGVLEETENTVCGRHPIAVAVAALEALGGGKRFRFVRYERSALVERVSDSSVSYAAAYAVI